MCLSQQLVATAIQGVHRWLKRLDRLTQEHLQAVPRQGEWKGITTATDKAIKEVAAIMRRVEYCCKVPFPPR